MQVRSFSRTFSSDSQIELHFVDLFSEWHSLMHKLLDSLRLNAIVENNLQNL